MNQLIYNFKKPKSRENNSDEWWYKENAILNIAKLIVAINIWGDIKKYTWVPIPSSKIKTDTKYDDRLVQVLNKINYISGPLDIRDMLVSLKSWDAAHENKGTRPSIGDHISNIFIDERFLLPQPKAIVIFDDVITRGASFKSAKMLLIEKFPSIPIYGLFIARAIRIPT